MRGAKWPRQSPVGADSGSARVLTGHLYD